MSWPYSAKKKVGAGRASTVEILACFDDEYEILLRLAILIAGDTELAERSVSDAREMAVHGATPLPFREQLTEWVKWTTIKAAIRNSLLEIGSCEPKYLNWTCIHSEHFLHGNDSKLQESRNFVLQVKPEIFIAGLDSLARAVAILRTTARASILDCTLRLNVSPDTVLAANCQAMTWLTEKQNRSDGEAKSSETKVAKP